MIIYDGQVRTWKVLAYFKALSYSASRNYGRDGRYSGRDSKPLPTEYRSNIAATSVCL